MKIYQDVFSGDELISDSYKFTQVFEGVAFEVKSRMVVKGEENVDIGCGNAFGGTNEEGEQSSGNGGAPKQKVIDIVDAFHYEDTSFDKPSFQKYFKGYMKKLLKYLGQNNPDRVEPFKKNAIPLFEFILANFEEFSFHLPQSFQNQNMTVMSWYKNQQDDAPTFLYIMDGLKSYKV